MPRLRSILLAAIGGVKSLGLLYASLLLSVVIGGIIDEFCVLALTLLLLDLTPLAPREKGFLLL